MDGREAMAATQFYVQYRNMSMNGGVPEGEGIQQMVPTPFIGRAGQSLSAQEGAGTPMKRKRGRPRKYEPEGVGMEVAGENEAVGEGAGKRGRGRPPGSGRRQQLAAIGGWLASSAGTGFTPHSITVGTGEDITAKIKSFSQQGPRAVCILSANGSVSSVTLRQPTSDDTVTYEGSFEILSMSGSYLLTEDGGSSSRSGGINICLSSSDGRVIGGGVGGLLVASRPVQIVVGSFIYGGSKAKNKTENVQEAGDLVAGEPSTSPAPLPGGWPCFDQADTQNSDQRD